MKLMECHTDGVEIVKAQWCKLKNGYYEPIDIDNRLIDVEEELILKVILDTENSDYEMVSGTSFYLESKQGNQYYDVGDRHKLTDSKTQMIIYFRCHVAQGTYLERVDITGVKFPIWKHSAISTVMREVRCGVIRII